MEHKGVMDIKKSNEYRLDRSTNNNRATNNKYYGKDKNKCAILFKNAINEIENTLAWMNRNNIKIKKERFFIEIKKLRKLFLDLGEQKLLKQSYFIEALLKQEDMLCIESNLTEYINNIKNCKKELQFALNNFKKEDNCCNCSFILTEEEYEQRLRNTIYYIRIADYDSIINELVMMINFGDPAFKEELQKALDDVLEFEYDKVLKRIINVKAIMRINAIKENRIKEPNKDDLIDWFFLKF